MTGHMTIGLAIYVLKHVNVLSIWHLSKMQLMIAGMMVIAGMIVVIAGCGR